ncbi:MAG TPA: Holliday junction branch migration DNA helicase RuvB [Pirellulaceae bacterium]|nr:Holliday junction branch migration DNA helicase RuvB [Pirellulaceae bacterium]HMO92825.1 Holliday junction branch migration DNA helicase RuvB [Pirellulaceae bacterium]HMP69432.1 Holliday junction branch migration DNA helicase RuvB [Pirellulaceae bacterium]
MAREPIIKPNTSANSNPKPLEESPDEVNLRPRCMEDIIGQKEVVKRLRIAINAAKQRGEVLGHILLDGPPGLGKTTFATCIPAELGVHVDFLSGPAIKAPKDLLPCLTNLRAQQVLFIDEIHRLPTVVEEFLYTAMEDFRIDLTLGEGLNSRTHNFRLKPFTLIGATTRAGMLSTPLRDRFLIKEHLRFYSDEELAQIVKINARKLDVTIDSAAALEIAQRSRSTPRIANNRLRWIRDFAQSKASGHITCQVVSGALEMAEIDSLGLDHQDREYLRVLTTVFGGGPVGIDAIAATLSLSSDTLADEVEPYLLRSEMITRTPRGRKASAKAFHHMNVPLVNDKNNPGQMSLPFSTPLDNS